jgi:hypothetical protein
MNITLKRVCTGKVGTFGVMVLNNVPVCTTLEDPDNGNQKNISCIPAGTYKCVRHNGTKYKGVWRLLNVPNREAILIHAGNTINDTEGCILVGQKFTPFGIGSSLLALNDLRDILPDDFTLTIEGV